jgi:hypothetical protein
LVAEVRGELKKVMEALFMRRSIRGSIL